MATYYLNGTPLEEGADITLNGFSYPYSWLEGTTPSIRASLGIEKFDDANYNPKYFWSAGNPKNLEDRQEEDDDGNPLYVKVFDPTVGEYGSMVDSDERLVAKGLKTICLTEIKNKTNELLKSTDYFIIRNEVENITIPQNISEYRTAVVQESTRLQTAIPTVDSVEQLIEVMESANFPKAQ